MTESCLSSVLWASKTLAPAAPDMNHVAERLKLCLPMAAGLPIGGSGDFGISPFFRQLTDKPLLVSMYIDGVSDAKSHRGREISVQNLLAVRLPPRAQSDQQLACQRHNHSLAALRCLSSDARCNTPRRFGIGRIETSGSVAMRGYSHLSDDEREQIGLLKVLGHSIGAIARAIRRPKSTISRELSRNRLPSGRYSPLHAAGAYQLRRRREALIEKDRALRSFVLDRLAEGWTPEQIAGWLKAGNERRLRAVGCETIYAFIYRAAQKAEQLWRYLTRRHKRRRPRRSRPSRDTIKDRVSIHERPENIDARTEAGHWEGDLIICKRTRPVLVLHERKSRVTLAARLVGKTAAETISVMLAVFARIEPTLRRSITFDNDTAFAQHARLKTMCAMTTWFCDAYASWQKGGVENANGRLRRWLPRQIDIDKVSDEEIQDIILTANLTPRKCLGFKTPFQAILKELGKDVQIQFS